MVAETSGEPFFTVQVLLTLLICLVLAAAAILVVIWLQHRLRDRQLAQQRAQQEGTIDRLLSSFGEDKDELAREHQAQLAEREARITALERENGRLRDRLTSSGIAGLFGGGRREVLSALLLENEQLHELLTQKQEQMREMMGDLTQRLMDRLDEQTRESAQAVRYKQALLSAFLQQQETRQLLDRLIADGQVRPESAGTPEEA
jgi:cell division protein FtsL